MLRVFPSRLEGEPLELHETFERMTVRAWLEANAPKLDLTDPPITLHLNGVPATLDTEFGPDDTLDIHVEPRGISLIVAAVVAAVVAVAMALLMPKPAAPRSQQQGKGLETVHLDANVARIGEPIPEIFGRPPRVYPDFLVPPRAHYIEPKVQVMDALLCVGKGTFQKSLSSVYIGDTQAVNLGADAEFAFHEPGASLVGVPQAEWWHSPQEVGFTSRGGSGLELGVMNLVAARVDQDALNVDGKVVYANSPSVPFRIFPADWQAGLFLDVRVPFAANIISPTTISSKFAMAHFTPQVGQIVAISGTDQDGDYEVASYTPASSGTPADPGTPSSLTGVAAPARLDFGDVTAALTVQRGVQTFQVLLAQNYGGAADLVTAIASQLNSTSVNCTLTVDGYVEFTERAPFSGNPIVVTGTGASDVFSGTPVSVTGTATTAAIPAGEAAITLVGANFTTGPAKIAIGPAGHRYIIATRLSPLALELAAPGVPSFVGWPTSHDEVRVFLDSASQEAKGTGPFTATPPCALANAFEVDYVFVNGLIRHSKKGDVWRWDVYVYVDWREVGTTTWNRETFYHIDSEPDAIGFTQRIDLPRPMSVEVRMSRNPKETGDRIVQEAVQWTGLRARLIGAPTSYPDVTLLSIRLRSGDRISSQSDNKVWLRNITRILPTVEDENVSEPTRDIMPAVLHMLSTVGYGRNRVNMLAAKEIHDILKARQDTWDFAAKDSTTLKTLANHALKAGFSELVVDRGLIKPVRDAIRDAPEYIYSPQEFTDYPTISTRMIEPDEVDGVDAEYVDSGTGRVETVQYRLPSDMGRRVQKISLIGVTDPLRAWRLAARHRRTLAYRRTIFKGETELQALNSSYMSYDRVQDGIPGYGQSAFVTSVAGQTLTVSEELDWSQPGALVVAFRQMNGRLTRPMGAARGESDRHVVLSEPIPLPIHFGGDNRDPTMVYFGTLQNWSREVLVTSITPGRDNRVTIEAVEYDARVYVEDDRDPRGVTFLTTAVYPEPPPPPPPPPVTHEYTMEPESLDVSVALVSGEHTGFQHYEYTMEPESLDVSVALVSGEHTGFQHYEYTMEPESLDVSVALVSGEHEIAILPKIPEEKIEVCIDLIGGEHESG